MDFLSQYQKSATRLIHKGRVALGLKSVPQKMVLDMRGKKRVPDFFRATCIEQITQNSSLLFVIQIDKDTDIKACLSCILFLHRIDCAIWVYAFDCFPVIPLDQLHRYVHRKEKKENIEIPDWFSSVSYSGIEVVYNQYIDEHIQSFNTYRSDLIRLVLPERSIDLPSTDCLLDTLDQSRFFVGQYFVHDLQRLRKEREKECVGYRSSQSCRIDQIQLLLTDDGVFSCPHKSKDRGHIQEIRTCSRSCVTVELRMPSIRRGLFSFDMTKILRRFS